MKVTFLILTTLFSCFSYASEKEQGTKKLEPSNPQTENTVDLLQELQYLNSEKFTSPPSKFKKGHAHAIKTPTPKLTDTKGAKFTIQVNTKSPIVTPTIYKGKIYSSGGFSSKKFFCFDAKTGKTLWGVDLDDDGPSCAAIEDDVVTFNTESCTLFALDANTGKHLWSHWLGDPQMSSPAVHNGFVYSSYPSTIHAAKGKVEPTKNLKKLTHVIACFKLKTGEIVWQKWIDSDIMTAPVVMPDGLHFTTFGGNYYHFDLTTGKAIAARKERATSAPLIVNNKIAFAKRSEIKGQAREGFFFCDKKGKVIVKSNDKNAVYLEKAVQEKTEEKGIAMALDAGNGFAAGAPATANAAASYSNIGIGNVCTLQQFQGSRGVAWGNHCFSCMGDEIVSMNQVTGKVEWKIQLKGDLKKLGGFLSSSPALANGKIVVGTITGKVLIVDAKNGKITKQFDAGAPIRSQVSFHDGIIYVGTQNGRIVCFDSKDKELSGWTTLGANAARTGNLKKDK